MPTPVPTAGYSCFLKGGGTEVWLNVTLFQQNARPTPAPPTPPPPPPCTGSSSGLNEVSCAAWQDLAKATNIAGWSKCNGNLLSPCSCVSVTCADNDITKIDLSASGLTGTIPSSLGSLAKLTSMDLFQNGLKGTIPPSLASLAKLTRLCLYFNFLTGLVPPLPFKQYSNDCVLDQPNSCAIMKTCNHFKCPLPVGSDQCKTGGGVRCK
jgi:hypothetical protein